MMVDVYNPSTQRIRQDDHKFKANLSYTMRPCHKATKKKIKREKEKETRE
jgi:hypothetical protein